MVRFYGASEAPPNLVRAFSMLPLLSILKLKALNLVGYDALQMMLHIPSMFFSCWFFASAVPYIPPVG